MTKRCLAVALAGLVLATAAPGCSDTSDRAAQTVEVPAQGSDSPEWRLELVFQSGWGLPRVLTLDSLGAMSAQVQTPEDRELTDVEWCRDPGGDAVHSIGARARAVRSEFGSGFHRWSTSIMDGTWAELVLESDDGEEQLELHLSWVPSDPPVSRDLFELIHRIAIAADQACDSYSYRLRFHDWDSWRSTEIRILRDR